MGLLPVYRGDTPGWGLLGSLYIMRGWAYSMGHSWDNQVNHMLNQDRCFVAEF